MNLGFIGVGKIAEAIIEGLASSSFSDITIYLSPRNETRSAVLATTYPNVHRLRDNQEVLDRCDTVIIALRPATALDILRGLLFDRHHTIVSLVPLLKQAELAEAVSPATDICRAIPLPPVVYHQCPIPLLHANEKVTRLFAAIGQPLPVADETQLHALWTLTGLITPFYEQLQALSEWTIAHGVGCDTANAYIANLYHSLSFMAQQSDPVDFGELGRHAATAGGMNEQAARELREKGVPNAYRAASDHLLERFR